MSDKRSWWRSARQRSSALTSRLCTFEQLDARQMLAGDLMTASDDHPAPMAAGVEPQYAIQHPPRLQLGNAPLSGTPAYDGRDQVEIVWQTISAGNGTNDAFTVEYRRVGQDAWISAPLNASIDTGVGTRVMHSAVIKDLDWSTDYEYRVRHVRAGSSIGQYEHGFRTRLKTNDPRPFTFGAYGDSNLIDYIDDVNKLQSRLLERDLDFSLLLGDNIYDSGSHTEADVRFDPLVTPESTAWNAGKIDYLSVGNHDKSTDDGKPSQELFSVPIPTEGVNAHAQLPDGEFAEFTYSFDYGDAHFVTFDGTVTDIGFPFSLHKPNERVERFVDYLEADLNASDARWKIVFVHHPILSADKFKRPSDYYFQQVISRLADEIDLLLVSHSHTFSWTYPIHGFTDADQSGMVTFDEIEYIQDTDHAFEKGAGLVQVISGVGGKGGNDVRDAEYEDSVFVKGFSDHDTTPQDVVGFASVDVTQRSLKVSYISAETGGIVGDENGNGLRDDGEPHFAQFEIVDSSMTNPDFNDDRRIDALDIDTLALAVRENSDDLAFDLDGDGEVHRRDIDFLLRSHLGTTIGDANLDGVFNSGDFVQVFLAGEYEDQIQRNSTWQEGDWDGDGDFTSSDLVAAFEVGSYSPLAVPAAHSAAHEIASAVNWLLDPTKNKRRR